MENTILLDAVKRVHEKADTGLLIEIYLCLQYEWDRANDDVDRLFREARYAAAGFSDISERIDDALHAIFGELHERGEQEKLDVSLHEYHETRKQRARARIR
jgi:hypothetical protein